MSYRQKDVVYVYSALGGLAKEVQSRLPEVEVKDVPVQGEPSSQHLIKLRFPKVKEEEIELLQDAEIVLIDGPMFDKVFDRLPRAQWVQSTLTGVNYLLEAMANKQRKPSFLLTRNIDEGVSHMMAEHVIGQMVNHERGWFEAMQDQSNRIYNLGDRLRLYRTLQDLHVGLLGFGSMGQAVAKALKFFGCVVYGYGRTPRRSEELSDDIDKYWHAGQLFSFLEECDYLINILPSTSETRGLLGGETLKNAKKRPVFINIGRGDVISEQDLLEALDEGWISAALLDVFEKEPLPKSSRLWSHPKVTLTPHSATGGTIALRAKSAAQAFVENYRRYKNGEPLLGLVDLNAGY